MSSMGINDKQLAYAMAHAMRSEILSTLSFLAVGSWNKVYKGMFPNDVAMVATISYKSPKQLKLIPTIVPTMTLALYRNDIKCSRVYA